MAWENFKQKKLVFTVATGRCGTAFFSRNPTPYSRNNQCHEPEPEYADVLREVQQDPRPGPMLFWWTGSFPLLAGIIE